MDKQTKKLVEQVKTFEDALFTQKLPTATFSDILTRILYLRKQYKLDFDGKYVEASQFLCYLKALLEKREKTMANATFDSVLKIMANLHKEFESKDAQQIFINREIEYIGDLATNMSKNSHSMTTRRLNEIAKRKAELQKQNELIK